MMLAGRLRRIGFASVVIASIGSLLTACSGGSGGPDRPATTAAVAPTTTGTCGDFRIAYDPGNGYEASAFLIGTIAEDQLGCTVTYVRTTSRRAWNLVAGGAADVYLDAYGASDVRARLTRPGGPVTAVGANGVHGVVSMVAPFFMGERGLESAQDLADTAEIGWGVTTPAVTTVPELLPLARAFVEFLHLDYAVRNYNQVGGGHDIGALLQQPGIDNDHEQPNLYLVEAPRGLLGDRPGQHVVDIPGSAAQPCQPDRQSTLCTFDDFRYQKIANTAFAESGSPAYALVYNYRLDDASVANILELVTLSGYDVGAPDVASWLNTHSRVWRRWLP